ncbi:NAD(P)/FAD-dependent oxidoreductase [Cytophaga sp. FL35]|uniref:dihydrolipoyl dehydrogenase family protein n=1 Tax=Cytophaga sp. FL35 TaxID=1904456 RepID=UPI001653D665|nr:NAD(P)/FAD-dependent oxidoreductase [Cytophaga sp. FL35]MBC6999345.1 NAD(P)/FAD-dependent oxidoreductase [Cytophaga sp. FL35]
MEVKKFDVFVIGSGIAGQTVATNCAKAGLKVAVADKREFGGTCANRGCDPKKVLLAATEVLESAALMDGKGVNGKLEINWKKLQKFKSNFTEAVPKSTEEKLKDLGIKLYHQSPQFLDKNTLEVEGKKVQAQKIVIATGYEPRVLPIKGHKLLKNSDDFLDLKKLPKKLIYIGAGYIGMEFAHMAARAGSKVTIIDSGKRALKPFDADLVGELINYSKKIGIEFIFGAQVEKVERLRKKYKIYFKTNGKNQSLKAGLVFNTAGRVPAVSQLDLDKGVVEHNEYGIVVNSFLQNTTNENVYACGDVSDNEVPLTPLSGREGYVVSQNIIHGNTKKLNTPVVPSVVFTLPHLASVGYSEKEAKNRYKNVIVREGNAKKWFNAKRKNYPVYNYKIILNKRTQEIVGAHILSPDAAETINIFAMAINKKMTAGDIKGTIFTYPSWINDVKSMV